MKSNCDVNNNFKELLKFEAEKMNINLTDNILNKFEIYKDLLIEWNEKFNLTAIIDEYGIIMKHFIDCLEIVKYINKNQKIIDIGTGAGFPGIVIAIYFDGEENITLVDSLNKRILFLEECINKMELKNVEVIHARAEELANNDKYRENFDIAVSRAVASLNVLLEYDSPYIKVNGKCLLLKGDNAEKEIDEAKNAIKCLNLKYTNKYLYTYSCNEETYNRYLLEITKISNTPNKYPRNYGKIKKNPL